jgi:hypothetical protein
MATPSKLAREDWPQICDGLDQGRTQAALAAGYGCSRQAVSKLVHSSAFQSFRQQRRRQQVAQQVRRQRQAVREPVASGGIRAEQRGGSAERRPSGRVHPDTIDPLTGKRFPNARENAGLAPMPDESWADLEDAEREARGYRLAEVRLDAPARTLARAGILSNTDLLQRALSG